MSDYTCNDCDEEYSSDSVSPECPECGSLDFGEKDSDTGNDDFFDEVDGLEEGECSECGAAVDEEHDADCPANYEEDEDEN